jgi:hypothetical protein
LAAGFAWSKCCFLTVLSSAMEWPFSSRVGQCVWLLLMLLETESWILYRDGPMGVLTFVICSTLGLVGVRVCCKVLLAFLIEQWWSWFTSLSDASASPVSTGELIFKDNVGSGVAGIVAVSVLTFHGNHWCWSRLIHSRAFLHFVVV